MDADILRGVGLCFVVFCLRGRFYDKTKEKKRKNPGDSCYIRNSGSFPDVDRKDLTSAENPSTKMATNRLNRT